MDKFSELDRKGIAEGKAYVGMTKPGVMTALGYPATHRTPSPDANTWVYWRNRFGTMTVQFDDRGIVTSVER
jgi:outer membrane protein assembly factor BamE (lipoprotein component of BamABCDE complex)